MGGGVLGGTWKVTPVFPGTGWHSQGLAWGVKADTWRGGLSNVPAASSLK